MDVLEPRISSSQGTMGSWVYQVSVRYCVLIDLTSLYRLKWRNNLCCFKQCNILNKQTYTFGAINLKVTSVLSTSNGSLTETWILRREAKTGNFPTPNSSLFISKTHILNMLKIKKQTIRASVICHEYELLAVPSKRHLASKLFTMVSFK